MSPASNHVAIAIWKTPSPSEDRARQIAEWLGASAGFASLESVGANESLGSLVPSGGVVVVHAQTLVRVAERLQAGAGGLRRLLDGASHVFVYGFRPGDGSEAVLQALSEGRLNGVAPLPEGGTFRVARHATEFCGQFAGLPVEGSAPRFDAVFTEGAGSREQDVLIRAAGEPFFIRFQDGATQICFAASAELADLDEPFSPGASLLPWFSRVVPLVSFLKAALGSGVWHNANPRACFIIDDPLLKDRYGFLQYSKLLETTSKTKASLALAFIPWNYKRSRKQTALRVGAEPGAFSLCIHGCDHTRAEFAAADVNSLRGRARLALQRMRVHSQLSGLRFDDVMVFPQGLFSVEAIEALQQCGYLAAVNTDLCPANQPDALRLRDVLDPAVTKFGGFPLFGRHYPRDAAEFAFDLFLGKPAFAVEHHGYFRRGYEPLEEFASVISQLDDRLQWGSLAEICSEACLTKTAPSGDIHVRFFASRFRLTNTGTRTESYVVFRPWPSDRPLPSVTVSGAPAAPRRKSESLSLTLSLQPGQTAEIGIQGEAVPQAATESWKPNLQYKASVLVRRFMSEFRDNYVDTNRILAGLLTALRRARAAGRAGSQDLRVEA